MFSIVSRDILICSKLKKQFNPSITKAILGLVSDLRTREDKSLSKKLRKIVKKYGALMTKIPLGSLLVNEVNIKLRTVSEKLAI
jgi:ribosomal protein L34E